MNYSVINNLPIDFCYRDYSLESLKNNADWFFENKSTRLEILKTAVSSQYQCDFLDYSCDSLKLLAKWLNSTFEKVPLTTSQLEEKRAKTASYIDIEDWRLSDISLSMVFDVGVFLGEMMIYNHQGLEWQQYLKNKKNNDYGHMIIDLGKIYMNPIWLVYIQVLKMADGSFSETCLSDIYNVWCDFMKSKLATM